MVFSFGIFAAGTSVAAEAPLASHNDKTAAPNNGTAHARCFRFEACFARDMVGSSHTFGQMFPLAGKTLAGFGQFPQRRRGRALCEQVISVERFVEQI